MKHDKQKRTVPIHAFLGAGFVLVSLIVSLLIPYNIAPEFSGSAELTVRFDEPTEVSIVEAAVSEVPFSVTVLPQEGTGYQISSQSLSDEEYQTLLATLTDGVGAYTIEEYQSFSPSISQELVRKAILAIIFAMALIIAYVSFVFRNTSPVMASWKYGTVAVVALVHDVAVPFGVFAVISPFSGAVIDTLFITAILATLGYSVNDTIVIFDRIRDRLRMNRDRQAKESFEESVRYGVRTSIRRSVYTSLSTVLPLLLLFLTVPTMKWFALALFVGVIAGTYSSLFFGPALLMGWNRLFPQREKKEGKKGDTQRAEESLRTMLHGEDVL
ncbi:MAG: protein translocase subunit SecF [Candidatus Kaiserbacteria bacterium]|nr:protein translocase subunit SecF [Candidatus Kaiserbacteria bacterium]